MVKKNQMLRNEDMTINEWLKSNTSLTKEKYFEFIEQMKYESHEIQILFFKKVLSEIAKSKLDISIIEISKILNSSELAKLDFNLILILHTLSYVSKTEKFPNRYSEIGSLVKNISDFICNFVENDTNILRKVDLLFENCNFRTAVVKKSPDEAYIHLRGNDYKVYDFYKGYSIINRDKSGWGTLVFDYEQGIYAKGEICMIEILERKNSKSGSDLIKYGNNIEYRGVKYPFIWKKDKNEFLIVKEKAPVVFCEGRKSDIPCSLTNKEFWWCYNRKCLQANHKERPPEEWINYTFRDILKILNLKFDVDGYYMFISEINRLNRIIERIKCTECDSILRPKKQTNYAFYRVSYFHCTNKNCSLNNEEVYLSHCLNKRCTNVIDSRIAKKCPNDSYICDVCGSCCSNDQFKRRIEALQVNGKTIPNWLFELYELKKGHFEKSECYCFKCQKEMNEVNGDFICEDCKVKYDKYNIYIARYKDFAKQILEKRKQKKRTTNP